MSIRVEEYLTNIEQQFQDKRAFKDGSIMMFGGYLNKIGFFQGFSKNELEIASLPNGLKLYLKRFYCEDELAKMNIANELVFSRLYNALGVNAVKYYPLVLSDRNQDYGKDVAIMSQDLDMINGICVEPFNSYFVLKRYLTKYKLNINDLISNQDELYFNSNSDENSKTLLANFIKTGLLDIICMMADNHLGNKRIIRKNRLSTPEDIISFDLEDSEINLFDNGSYNDFIYKLSQAKDFRTGAISIDSKDKSYIGCLNSIKDLLQEGKFPNECVNLLDNLVNLNFDELLRGLERETGFIVPSNRKDLYKELIDVNQETFCK